MSIAAAALAAPLALVELHQAEQSGSHIHLAWTDAIEQRKSNIGPEPYVLRMPCLVHVTRRVLFICRFSCQ